MNKTQKVRGRFSGWKSLLTFALLPAFITAIVPVIYSEFTKSYYALTFTSDVSPPIKSGELFEFIFALDVHNSGSSTLHNVSIKLKLEQGTILGGSAEQLGVSQTIKRDPNIFEQVEQTLHPGESVKVALLIQSKDKMEPEIAIRSDEVGAVRNLTGDVGAEGTSWPKQVLWLFPLVYGSVIATAVLFRRTRGLEGIASYKNNVIAFVSAACGIPRLQDNLWSLSIFSNSMEFFGAADLITSEGKALPSDKRQHHVLAIECLVLTGARRKQKFSLLENLKILDPNYSQERYDKLVSDAPATLTLSSARQLIVNHTLAHSSLTGNPAEKNTKYPAPPHSQTPPFPR
jgi:hypothetical protein